MLSSFEFLRPSASIEHTWEFVRKVEPFEILSLLPESFLDRIVKVGGCLDRLHLDREGSLTRYIEASLRNIVACPAFFQALKGIVSAGPSRALAYSIDKLRKGRR